MAAALALMIGTLASEDLACVAAGLLIQQQQMTAAAAIAACAIGIFLGDLGLWAIGRTVGPLALDWPWIAGRIRSHRFDDLCASLRRHAACAILVSRFLPGTRLALYVSAGVVRVPGRRFAIWALVAAFLWTPILVLTAAGVGATVARSAAASVESGGGRALVACSFVAALAILAAFRHLCRPGGPHRRPLGIPNIGVVE
jgi:membrane protein DedA with SNARE-associated domain